MKAKITSDCDLRVLPGDLWRTIVPLTAEVEDHGFVSQIVVPPGFETDLASIPRLPGVYLLFGGKGRVAAVIHDWLYRFSKFHRDFCDEVFLALLEHEEPAWRRNLMWAGVRLGGWMFWHKRPDQGSRP